MQNPNQIPYDTACCPYRSHTSMHGFLEPVHVSLSHTCSFLGSYIDPLSMMIFLFVWSDDLYSFAWHQSHEALLLRSDVWPPSPSKSVRIRFIISSIHTRKYGWYFYYEAYLETGVPLIWEEVAAYNTAAEYSRICL